MRITLGLTRSARSENPAQDYVPAMDGYRPGAEQDEITFEVTGLDPRIDDLEIAEAAFEATNSPHRLVDVAAALAAAWESAGHSRRRSPFRSLSVGDTVTITRGGVTRAYECTGAAWSELGTARAA